MPAPVETSADAHEDRNRIVRQSGTLVFIRTSVPDAILYDGDTEVGTIPLETGIVILASRGFHRFRLDPDSSAPDVSGQFVRGGWQEVRLTAPGLRIDAAAVSAGAAAPEASETYGSLSADGIRTVVRSHLPEVTACRGEGIARRPTIEGRVTTRFVIGPSGAVRGAMISSTTLGDAVVEDCITRRILDWAFPAVAGGGIVIVNYPLMLPGE